jgi:5-formyltetrahydrofolate cyclo-ligase
MWGTAVPGEPIVSDKAAVRAALLARRAALDPDARAQASAQVLAVLRAAVKGCALVAAYVPIGAEPGGSGLPDALRDAGARVLLPVLRPDNDLDWASYEGVLEPARRGLREPPGPRLGVDAVARAELVVVPALAVDRRGVRLGRGGGSYDRALARAATSAVTVALLHDGELLDEVPSERHDYLVKAVITPSAGWCDLPYIG